jgi:hypothetical protein
MFIRMVRDARKKERAPHHDGVGVAAMMELKDTTLPC